MSAVTTKWGNTELGILIGNLQAAEDFGATKLAQELRSELLSRYKITYEKVTIKSKEEK